MRVRGGTRSRPQINPALVQSRGTATYRCNVLAGEADTLSRGSLTRVQSPELGILVDLRKK